MGGGCPDGMGWCGGRVGNFFKLFSWWRLGGGGVQVKKLNFFFLCELFLKIT